MAQLQDRLKHVIQTYFRVKLNPELKFEEGNT